MREVERFPPSEAFRAQANWSDPAIYDEAAADTTSPDASNPPFYTWFADGQLNASAQCLDRHIAAGIGALHNVVFGGFSAESVAERMAFSHAKCRPRRRRDQALSTKRRCSASS